MKGEIVQLGSVFILGILSSFIAISLTWPSSALPILRSDQSPLTTKISQADENLLGSLPMLGGLISTVFAGVILEYIGRKRTEILCGLCQVLACAIIATAKSTPILFFGRFLSGIGNGMHMISVTVYASEICHVSVTGSMFAFLTLIYNSGSLVTYLTGWFCSYDVMNYLNLTICVVYTVLVCFLRETPSYLLRRGKEKEALDSLKFYRGVSHATPEVMAELDSLRQQVNATAEKIPITDPEKCHLESEKEKLNEDATSNLVVNETSVWKAFYNSKATQRATITACIIITLVTCMGTVAVQAYANQFFTKAAPNLTAHLCSVILALTLAFGCCITIFISDRVGRRVLMLASCITSTICMILLGSLLRWSWAPEWVTTLVVLVYLAAFQMGASSVPMMQWAEMFLPQVKSLATTIVVCMLWLSNFFLLAIFGPSVTYLGIDGTFFMFSAIGIVSVITVYFFMMETRGVPVEDTVAKYEKGYLYRER